MSPAPCRLNRAQRAFMREWIERCIVRTEAQPPSHHRGQSIALLRQALARYQDAPQLRVIAGGRA